MEEDSLRGRGCCVELKTVGFCVLTRIPGGLRWYRRILQRLQIMVAPFTAAVERENVMGVQFHPEKSAEVGVAGVAEFFGFVKGERQPWICADERGVRTGNGKGEIQGSFATLRMTAVSGAVRG